MTQWTPAKKTLALGAAVGTGLLVLHCRRRYADHNAAPVTLDADLKPAARKVILAALAQETDPVVLGVLQDKLEAAGHDRSAEVVGSKITSLHTGCFVGAWTEKDAIRQAQHLLRKIGYDVPEDGVMGPVTVAATKRFQSLHDLEIDGIVGSATLAALSATAGS
jgi:hypothetical protein